jgi:hypothetical protein
MWGCPTEVTNWQSLRSYWWGGGARFESHPGYWLSWLRFWASDHDIFYRGLFNFLFFSHPNIGRYEVYILTASWNKLQKDSTRSFVKPSLRCACPQFSLTNSPTWNIVLFIKFMVVLLVKNPPLFYGNRKWLPLNPILSQINPVHSRTLFL